MKKMSGTKWVLVVCATCFTLILVGVMQALGVPGKIIRWFKERD